MKKVAYISFLALCLTSITFTPLKAAEDNGPHEKDSQLELYADLPGPMLRGLTMSHQGRVFVTFPRLDGSSAYTLAELKKWQTRSLSER